MPGSDRKSEAAYGRRRLLALAGTSLGVGALGTVAATAEESEKSGPPSNGRGRGVGGDSRRLPSPGSEHGPTDGFANVEGGVIADGVTVRRVTNLKAAGEGSLRAAVAVDEDEPTLVVFEVGGVIDLEGQHLPIFSSNTLIAGQTAPSPGITVVRGALFVVGENVALQHLRVKPGDEIPRGGPFEGGAVDAVSAVPQANNAVIDHCTAAWGTDENLSTQASRTTVSNCLVAEGLRDSFHPDGEHAMGTLIGNETTEVALYGNVWAHTMERHPRIKDGTTSVVVNNVAHNYEDAVRVGDGPSEGAKTSIVGNYFQAGTRTDPTDPLVWLDEDHAGPAVYLADNAASSDETPIHGESVTPAEERPVWVGTLSALPVDSVLEHNLGTAGARPADRTAHDERILEDVREGTGDHIDSQDDVGGYPDLEATERELDVPDSGVREWLLGHTRAVELPDADPP